MERGTGRHVLVLGTALFAAMAFVPHETGAHGPGHAVVPDAGPKPDPASAATAPNTAADGAMSARAIPPHLLAAVCGDPAVDRRSGFERRLQLAKASQDWIEAYGAAPPPLFGNLGDDTFPITTQSDEAQRYFDQGLRLAYAFNHPEALRAFRYAERLDPACAMCAWGQAYVLGPNINAPMDPAAVGPAREAVERALARRTGASPLEQALIGALDARYAADPDHDRAALNAAYADAMATVAEAHPGNATVQSLYADALMNVSPWNYWEADGRTPQPVVADLVPTLERALAAEPRHPYAIHLYIHAVEASAAPERAEPYADRLAAEIPGAGHIVHMPSHIYFRIGRLKDSIAANRDAVAADEAYLAEVSPEGLYPYSYYPHNVHFLLESARMAGDGATAVATAEKLPATTIDDVSAMLPWVQLIDAAPYFAHAQFSEPATVLALGDPGPALPYVKAMWHYARAVAHARRGDADAAEAEAEAMRAMGTSVDWTGMVDGGVPAPELLALAGHVIDGRIRQTAGEYEGAAAAFEQAVVIQDALPYLEPPYWYYPVRQSLGAALLQAGRPAEAEAAFAAALARFPNNAWSLYGLKQAQEAQGKQAAAAATQQRLNAALVGDPADLDLARL